MKILAKLFVFGIGITICFLMGCSDEKGIVYQEKKLPRSNTKEEAFEKEQNLLSSENFSDNRTNLINYLSEAGSIRLKVGITNITVNCSSSGIQFEVHIEGSKDILTLSKDTFIAKYPQLIPDVYYALNLLEHEGKSRK